MKSAGFKQPRLEQEEFKQRLATVVKRARKVLVKLVGPWVGGQASILIRYPDSFLHQGSPSLLLLDCVRRAGAGVSENG